MQKLIGKIEHRKTSADSQSKTREWYVLVMDDDSIVIRLKGENPFEQPTLKGLIGKRCEAEGTDDGMFFLADTIKEVGEK